MTDVAIVRCADYADVEAALTRALAPFGGLDWVRPGMKVALKINLVSGGRPDSAVATHPALVSALCRLLTARGAQVRVGRAQSATKQIVRAVVCFAAWTALFGAAALLLACWAQVYQNSMDTYTRTFGRLFYLGMDGRTAFQSLVYEGVLYWKRTITLLLPVMAFGETYYVGNVYEYGFDQLFRMLAEAVLRAARDAGLYTAACVPLILIAAAVFGRGLEQRAKRRALAGRR